MGKTSRRVREPGDNKHLSEQRLFETSHAVCYSDLDCCGGLLFLLDLRSFGRRERRKFDQYSRVVNFEIIPWKSMRILLDRRVCRQHWPTVHSWHYLHSTIDLYVRARQCLEHLV